MKEEILSPTEYQEIEKVKKLIDIREQALRQSLTFTRLRDNLSADEIVKDAKVFEKYLLEGE